MDTLLKFINELSPEAREGFAQRCATTVGYLRKACSIKQKIGENLCIAIERESGGKVTCESLRSDVDWAYLRGSRKARTQKRAA